jgi:hypothetical protein
MNHVEPVGNGLYDEVQQKISKNASADGKERAIAIVDHQPKGASQLEFKKDDIIVVLEKFPTGWWKGEVNGRVGVFPKNTVQLLGASPATSPPPPAVVDNKKETKDKKSKEKKHKRKKDSKEKETNDSLPEVPKNATSLSVSATTPSTQSPSNTRPQSSTTIAVALYDFKATRSDQLSFNKGDKIVITEKRESGWWRGELNGVSGLVPSNYIKEELSPQNSSAQNLRREEFKETQRSSLVNSGTSTSTSGYTSVGTTSPSASLGEVVVAQFNYTPSGPGQLALKRGDQIVVLEKPHNGWWRGECNGNVGIFPSNYVKPITEINSPDEYEGTIEVEDEAALRKKKPISKARVIYSYQGSSDAELTIEPNQIVSVLGKLENGWWQGEVNGRYGHFPGDYVEEIIEDTAEVGADSKTQNKSVADTAAIDSKKNETPETALGTRQAYSPSGRKPPDKPLPPLPPTVNTTLRSPSHQSSVSGKSTPALNSVPVVPIKLPSPLPTPSHSPPLFVANASTNATASTASVSAQDVNLSEGGPLRGLSKPPGRRLSPSVSSPVSPSLSPTSSLSKLNSDVKDTAVKTNTTQSNNPNVSSSSSSGPGIDSTALTLEMIKNALILLQQQTKTAVEEVLKRIETQQTERMKLEFVMRDMKKCMKEELQRREAIEADVQLLQSHVNIVKKEGQKKASIEAMPNELVQYVLILSRNVEREIRIRKEMEQQVSQLRRDVTILLDKIAGMSK